MKLLKLFKLETALIKATFVKESKNRFLCEVLINETIELCYVPSSARLENFLIFKNKTVFLTPNPPSAKTKYTLWSVLYRNKHILLNLKKVNSLIELAITNNLLQLGAYESISREKTINSYKCDLFLNSNPNHVIEIKTIICTSKIGLFPTVYSTRAINQLKELKSLLSKGFKVTYILVSLSSSLKEIAINSEYQEFYSEFLDCVHAGMNFLPITLYFEKDTIYLMNTLKIKN